MNAFEPDAVKALLEAGADPTLKANDGKTALDRAKSANCDKCVSLIRAAIKARAASPAQ
jgi:ankyrin repeat protein